ncbi:prephenate dehydrogenase [Flaviaesturariibacter flavus]|uniref:prephenate dehydrogenase n=1 Tax=Flaviaesturariibacter flavus TaxID=2502780 RepID=UPI0014048430|nr:prephenate dehydrogenase [Flaviaesturariibacter flavus]
MKLCVIGLGLIGGSLALGLRDRGRVSRVTGVDNNAVHAATALRLGLCDEVLPLEEAVRGADAVALAVPVDILSVLLPQVLDLVDRQVVFDVGSTKGPVLAAVAGHPLRGRFVAAHPMWGTEYSGPEAAVHGAFARKAAVLCDREYSDADAAQLVEGIFRDLGMHLVYMKGAEHDLHVAYVSHISHITSFALANTVLEKERADAAIFELASGGFESTVRLAKSSPAMWVPIFRQNRDNVLDVLNEHISQLRKFKDCLEKDNYEYLAELITQANTIKRIIR